MRRLVVFAVLGILLAGCIAEGRVTPVATTATTPRTDWNVPWQVAPATELTAKVHNDLPRLTFVKGWGNVLATPRVLASFPRALRSKRGRNRTVQRCKRQIELAAAPFGAARVEAASLGPERRSRRGLYEGRVEVRVIYASQLGYEVRQATMACFSRRDGSIVDAKAVFPINAEDGSDMRRS